MHEKRKCGKTNKTNEKKRDLCKRKTGIKKKKQFRFTTLFYSVVCWMHKAVHENHKKKNILAYAGDTHRHFQLPHSIAKSTKNYSIQIVLAFARWPKMVGVSFLFLSFLVEWGPQKSLLDLAKQLSYNHRLALAARDNTVTYAQLQWNRCVIRFARVTHRTFHMWKV